MTKKILRNKLYISIYSLVSVFFIFGSGATSFAAGFSNGFTVSPVRNIISVAKGQTQIVPITVENPGENPATAEVIINDFLPSENETGVPRIITDNNTTLPLDNFISLVKPVPDFTLAPDSQKIVNITISVPKNAIAGDYYGAIRFAPASSGTGVVALNATVATIFLLTVPGNLYQKLSLVQFSAADVNGNTSSFFTNGQLSMVTRLTNKGTTHSEPFGNIIIKNMFGHQVDNVQFNNTTPRFSILTQSTRKFQTSLKKQKWLGFYTATISIGYGGNGINNLITAKTTFWYIPLWLEILILIIIVLIVSGIIWIVRRRRASKFGRRIR